MDLVSNNFIEFLDLNYNFAIDNDLKSLEYSNFNAELKFNNFTTKLNFVEESGEMGSLILLKMIHILSLMKIIILPLKLEEIKN